MALPRPLAATPTPVQAWCNQATSCGTSTVSTTLSVTKCQTSCAGRRAPAAGSGMLSVRAQCEIPNSSGEVPCLLVKDRRLSRSTQLPCPLMPETSWPAASRSARVRSKVRPDSRASNCSDRRTGREQWLVVTRWRDEEAFKAWVASPAFAHGHAGANRPAPDGRPVSVASELWSYEVAGGSQPSPGSGRP